MTQSRSARLLPLRAEASLNGRGAIGLAAGLTLVEMLVAMAITLLIMAAVVTVFANVTSSVTNRRATIEMASALRNVRATLTRDLAGATCPAVPWQRPEANHGYLEIIEGPQNDYYPTPFLYDGDGDGLADPVRTGTNPLPGIDLGTSSLPGSDLGGDPINDIEGTGASIGSNALLGEETPTDGRGLGDADDILMLTVRNEDEPFVGRVPGPHDPPQSLGPSSPGVSFAAWSQDAKEVESQLAEVVWFAVENPVDPNRTFAFGEPGYRTIHRRALLILPELDYQINVTPSGVSPTPNSNSVAAGPGIVRVFQPGVGQGLIARALAGLIAFQERYDLSVRLEWDARLPGSNGGRWVLRANSLSDLTKRENRYEHHGFVSQPETLPVRHNVTRAGAGRFFPFAVASAGLHSQSATLRVLFVADGELPSAAAGGIVAVTTPVDSNSLVVAYQLEDNDVAAVGSYAARPLAIVNDQTDIPATARAILNEDGQVVHVTTGLAPLGGDRRGDDIMMTDALSFDLKLYDPGAPVYGYVPSGNTTDTADQMVKPGDPAWARAYFQDVPPGASNINNLPGNGTGFFPFARQGAYVDAGYGLSFVNPVVSSTGNVGQLTNRYTRFPLTDRWDRAEAAGLLPARFFNDGLFRTAIGPINTQPAALTRRFASYDTWSTHYESNGLNEDGDNTAGNLRTDVTQTAMIDEGVNGLDDPSFYDGAITTRFGPDDDAERETRPPYDTALRGMQATLRVYERDSRQIREVRIRESFVSE